MDMIEIGVSDELSPTVQHALERNKKFVSSVSKSIGFHVQKYIKQTVRSGELASELPVGRGSGLPKAQGPQGVNSRAAMRLPSFTGRWQGLSAMRTTKTHQPLISVGHQGHLPCTDGITKKAAFSL